MTDRLDAQMFFIPLAARNVGDYLYSWGGEAATEGGFNCSGFVWSALRQAARAWPALYDGPRSTAHDLYLYFDARGCPDISTVEDLMPGCLVFYRRLEPTARFHHVAIHAATIPPIVTPGGDAKVGPVAFEAGGGGSDTTSPRVALCRSAGVRLTASDRQGRDVEWLAKDPFVVLGSDGGPEADVTPSLSGSREHKRLPPLLELGERG